MTQEEKIRALGAAKPKIPAWRRRFVDGLIGSYWRKSQLSPHQWHYVDELIRESVKEK